jgi:hypothetical protein
MVTDRALLVKFQDGYYASLADLFESPGFEWEHRVALPQINGGLPATIKSVGPKEAETLLCKNLGMDSMGPVLTIAGNYLFLPFVERNPLYTWRTQRWFPRADPYATMIRTVFRPNSLVRHMVSEFLGSLAKKHGVAEWTCDVGFQIRNDNDPVHHPQVSAKEWELYRKCASELLPRAKRKDPPRVFVATDSAPSRDICQREIPYPFEVFGEFTRSNNPDGVRRALADALIFSTCRTMLTSPWSSYGRLATLYANRLSYFVTDWKMPVGEPHRRFTDIVLDESDRKAGCFRFLAIEDCPWQGPSGVDGFTDVIKRTTCWDASMIMDVC